MKKGTEYIGNGLTAYIAGPIKGRTDYKTEFVIAEGILLAAGYRVLSPTRLPDSMDEKQYMPICISMVEQADVVYLLDGWEDSLGALTEAMYAARQGKELFTVAKKGPSKQLKWDPISRSFAEV